MTPILKAPNKVSGLGFRVLGFRVRGFRLDPGKRRKHVSSMRVGREGRPQILTASHGLLFNGKENGSYYIIMGHIRGLYRDNGNEHGSYYLGFRF